MRDNDYFVRRKTVFIVFHAEYAAKFFEQAMRMHREFLKDLAEIRMPAFLEEDDSSWIP